MSLEKREKYHQSDRLKGMLSEGNMLPFHVDKKELSENVPFWSIMNEEEREFLHKNTVLRKYQAGEQIHDCRAECTGVLFIRQGMIRVYMISEDGKEITLYRLSSGDTCTLSAGCILQEITFEVLVDVIEPSEVWIVNALAVLELSQKNIYVENFLYRQTVEHFSEVMWAFQQIVFLSFDKRLAIFLLDESIHSKNDKICMTHDQIAKHLGSAREVVTRMLNYFSKEGIVELTRGEIWIKDKKELKNLTK